ESMTMGMNKVIRVAVTNLHVGLGSDPVNPLLSISNGQGFFIISSAGLVGRVSADVASNVADFSLAGSFSLAINTTTDPVVNETFRVGTTSVTLNVPAGKLLQVEGTNVSVTVAGQVLSGSFFFQQKTTQGNPAALPPTTPQTVVTVAFSNVTLKIGDGS